MKVAEAIEQYLAHQRQRGLEPSSVRTSGHALRTVLAPVITSELEALGAEGIGEALKVALEQRVCRASRKGLTSTTQEPDINAAKAFLGWAVKQGWIQKSPLAEVPARAAAAAPKHPTPPHVGQIIRNLREASGLTRQQFEEQVGLSATTIKAIDLGHQVPTAELVRKLLAHPSMAQLLAMAKQAGLELPTVDPESDENDGSDPAGKGGST